MMTSCITPPQLLKILENITGAAVGGLLSSSGNGVSFPSNTHNMEVGGALTLVYHIDMYIYI